MKNTLEYNGLKIKYGCKILPPKGYSAITLFGTVYTRKTLQQLLEYLNTENGKVWAHHEAIHTYQADTFKPNFLKWILFYIIYAWQFIKAWPLFMSWRQAYRTVCFELEAYLKEKDLAVTSSDWKKHVWSIHTRKYIQI